MFVSGILYHLTNVGLPQCQLHCTSGISDCYILFSNDTFAVSLDIWVTLAAMEILSKSFLVVR